MKLIQLNNSYSNPLDNNAYNDTFITDGILTDDPHNKKLRVSFRLQQKVIEEELGIDKEGNPSVNNVEKVKILSESTLIFNSKTTPTYMTVAGETKDLFEFLGGGGKLTGKEIIDIGYPNYDAVKKYFLKDNIGDFVEVNPELDDLGQMLVQKFILERVIINGEPIGKQFKF